MPEFFDHAGSPKSLALAALGHIAFHYTDSVGTRNQFFYRGSMVGLHAFPADASPTSSRMPAHGSGPMAVRYSFIAVDLHHLLLAGLPAHLS